MTCFHLTLFNCKVWFYIWRVGNFTRYAAFFFF